MGFFTGSMLLIIAASAGSLAANIGLNTLQSWYDPLYADSFWGSPGLSAQDNARLAQEEAEVDALMRDEAPDAAAPAEGKTQSLALPPGLRCAGAIGRDCGRGVAMLSAQ